MTRGRRRPPRALLIDFDGVLRLWDSAWEAGVEKRFGLAPGQLPAIAFTADRLVPAITGRTTDDEWMSAVGAAVGSIAAVREWQSYRGQVDDDVRRFVGDLRAAGIPVALATNATDRLDADLLALGLSGAFDAVVNSSVIGVAKPHPEFFAAGCAALDVAAGDCLFVDDSPRIVAGARAAGLLGFRYTGPADLPYLGAAFLRS